MERTDRKATYFPTRLYRRKNGYYYCHVTVPHELRPIIRRVQIKQSLRTKNETVALKILRAVEAALFRFFDYAQKNKCYGSASYLDDPVSQHLRDIAKDVGFEVKEISR